MTDKEAQLIWETLQKVDEAEPTLKRSSPNSKCNRCDGSGVQADGKTCSRCNGKGELDRYGSPAGTDHRQAVTVSLPREAIPPQDDLDAQLNVHGDADVDHHNQHMMDQDLLQPIHQAANTATNGQAKNFNEWMIIQIKEQGDNWVNWFIETVIVEERFRS